MGYENELSRTLVLVQELESNASLPTLGIDNLELNTEALTLVVKKVLEEVFKARIRETSEMLQARCIDCGKKRDCSSFRLEPRSMKRVRTHLSDSKDNASSSTSVPSCEHCKRCHLSDC
ncbi:hypothetical protein J1N35_022896 [Gossypium stocksii]|uniref:Uncharacterized protein n=1 Tax=Gossypium stocksii TaxID=47602 RepID=A0A9D3VGV8_9ROSI|nr:hypothetical protein J1N35_022896 [Gossypium stocksii]